MQLGEDVIAMCRLVAFVVKERKLALAPNLIPEKYAKQVLRRYRKEIAPDAILLMGGKTCPIRVFDFVRCRVDNVWEFGMSKPVFMRVDVRPDGSIHLDEGNAEVIFNYNTDG